jgi:hypothetical protein
MKKNALMPSLLSLCYAISVSARRGNGSLNAKGWIRDKSCPVTTDTASLMIIRPDITTGLPERELTQPYVLETVSGETLTVLKGVLVELTLQRHPQQT